MKPAPLLPPTHMIDAPGAYISPSDPAWDSARFNAEIAEIKAKAGDEARAAFMATRTPAAPPLAPDTMTTAEAAELAEAVEAAEAVAVAAHPVLAYFSGSSRYQLDAPGWAPDGKPCTVRSYLREDVTPSIFSLVRPGRRRLRQVDAVADVWERREAWIRAVVRGIDGPAGAMVWTPARPDDEVPDEILEAMSAWYLPLIRQLADACDRYCGPLRAHESGL